ncbi:calcium-responsive transcription factor-like [Hydractinia symbiolongicarpus]|uniref:calcium-responsive transcription factor-like n=1 Tax=Hydractinia symbiolongicarpus TaxID=13093 RepID=UPI0025519083|nr:calcium-responsive transcription factor-like [Hydractinia symbiolongicarpus]
MDQILGCIHDLKKVESYYTGYLNTNSEVGDFLEDYRKTTGIFFAVSHNRSRDTDKSGHFKGTGAPVFEVKRKDWSIEFCGIPFICDSTIERCCMFGKTYKNSRKSEEGGGAEVNEHCFPKTEKKSRVCGTIKKDCPAKLIVRKVRMFPQNTIDKNEFEKLSYRLKRKIKHENLKALKASIINGTAVSVERFYIIIPTEEAHAGHNPEHKGDLLVQPLHKKLKNKIYDLVSEGLVNPKDIKPRLNDFVTNVIQKDATIEIDPHNSSYYPNLNTISNHVRLALKSYRYNELDEVSFQIDEILNNTPLSGEPGDEITDLPQQHKKDVSRKQEYCRILLKKAINMTHDCKSNTTMKECIDLCYIILQKLQSDAERAVSVQPNEINSDRSPYKELQIKREHSPDNLTPSKKTKIAYCD